MSKEFFDSISNEPLEYQIFAIYRTVAMNDSITRNGSFATQMANKSLNDELNAKKHELVEELNTAGVDWYKVKVIRSLYKEYPELSNEEFWNKVVA